MLCSEHRRDDFAVGEPADDNHTRRPRRRAHCDHFTRHSLLLRKPAGEVLRRRVHQDVEDRGETVAAVLERLAEGLGDVLRFLDECSEAVESTGHPLVVTPLQRTPTALQPPLLTITVTIESWWRAAVSSSMAWKPKLPSPTTQSTWLPGRAHAAANA